VVYRPDWSDYAEIDDFWDRWKGALIVVMAGIIASAAAASKSCEVLSRRGDDSICGAAARLDLDRIFQGLL